MFSFLLSSLIGCSTAFAQSSPINFNDPVMAPPAQEQMIRRPKRNQLIEQAGLMPETARMDELDKDLLILRAQKQPLTRLHQIYPTLPLEKLEHLQRALR